MAPGFPQRIICLTTETVELAYALGAGDRVVGVTGYATRPPEARQKPRVAAFTTANIERISNLRPDLVITFSDLQREIVRDLLARGMNVLALNQRSLEDTFRSIRMLGGVLGLADNAEAVVASMQRGFERVRLAAAEVPRRPRVLFEEWNDPLITGIRWVSEIVDLAGGDDIFAELAEEQSARGRIVDVNVARERDPELVLASWCGRKFIPDRVRTRPGWQDVSAVRADRLIEVKSPDILSPGPSLVLGAQQVHNAIRSTLGMAVVAFD